MWLFGPIVRALSLSAADQIDRCCFPVGPAISKNYQLTYPDGSKKHIDRVERDDLVLSGLARQTSPMVYEFLGQPRTYHSFAEWAEIEIKAIVGRNPVKRFLPGSFVIEHNGRRRRELLETPEHAVCRLRLA